MRESSEQGFVDVTRLRRQLIAAFDFGSQVAESKYGSDAWNNHWSMEYGDGNMTVRTLIPSASHIFVSHTESLTFPRENSGDPTHR